MVHGHTGGVVRHKMTNKKTRSTTKRKFKKRPRRQDNNVGDYLRLSTSFQYSRGGGKGIDIQERAEDRNEEGREKEAKTARCVPRRK